MDVTVLTMMEMRGCAAAVLQMDEVVCAHSFFLCKRGEADFASSCMLGYQFNELHPLLLRSGGYMLAIIVLAHWNVGPNVKIINVRT